MTRHSLKTQIAATETARHALNSPARNLMRGSERALLIEQLGSVLATLAFCEQHEADIRAYLAERRKAG